MGKYELINDASGNPAFAKVPLTDLEDMMDAIEGAAILERVKAGHEETFPGDLVHSIIAGENPIRAYRKHRSMTQSQLAETAGLKQPAIARAEKGGTTSVAALKAIAGALAVDIDMLVAD